MKTPVIVHVSNRSKDGHGGRLRLPATPVTYGVASPGHTGIRRATACKSSMRLPATPITADRPRLPVTQADTSRPTRFPPPHATEVKETYLFGTPNETTGSVIPSSTRTQARVPLRHVTSNTHVYKMSATGKPRVHFPPANTHGRHFTPGSPVIRKLKQFSAPPIMCKTSPTNNDSMTIPHTTHIPEAFVSFKRMDIDLPVFKLERNEYLSSSYSAQPRPPTPVPWASRTKLYPDNGPLFSDTYIEEEPFITIPTLAVKCKPDSGRERIPTPMPWNTGTAMPASPLLFGKQEHKNSKASSVPILHKEHSQQSQVTHGTFDSETNGQKRLNAAHGPRKHPDEADTQLTREPLPCKQIPPEPRVVFTHPVLYGSTQRRGTYVIPAPHRPHTPVLPKSLLPQCTLRYNSRIPATYATDYQYGLKRTGTVFSLVG